MPRRRDFAVVGEENKDDADDSHESDTTPPQELEQDKVAISNPAPDYFQVLSREIEQIKQQLSNFRGQSIMQENKVERLYQANVNILLNHVKRTLDFLIGIEVKLEQMIDYNHDFITKQFPELLHKEGYYMTALTCKEKVLSFENNISQIMNLVVDAKIALNNLTTQIREMNKIKNE